MFETPIEPDDVQYMGVPGMPPPCLWAVDAIVNSEKPPRRASVVTWMKDGRNSQGRHLILFWYWNRVPLTVVHSGFASGYPGDGPRSFSIALSMIKERSIPTNDIILGESEFYAIENRKLTPQLIELLRTADDRPTSWIDIASIQCEQVKKQTFWATLHDPKMNFDHIDPEISKQCRNLYSQDPDAAVAWAFVVVEERLRALVGKSTGDVPNLTGDALITKALHVDNGVLSDGSLTRSEREGMLLLFKGAFQFVRNPRAHRVVNDDDEQLTIDFMHLADLLLRILPDSASQGNSKEV